MAKTPAEYQRAYRERKKAQEKAERPVLRPMLDPLQSAPTRSFADFYRERQSTILFPESLEWVGVETVGDLTNEPPKLGKADLWKEQGIEVNSLAVAAARMEVFIDAAKELAELINAYNKRFPSIKRFLEECVMHAQSHGYVETILGRRRPLPDISSGVVALRNAAERMAINSVVQGSAADLIKIAMVNVYRRMKKENARGKLLLQVHDELVFEAPEAEAAKAAEVIRHVMETAPLPAVALSVPLVVDARWAGNWDEAH